MDWFNNVLTPRVHTVHVAARDPVFLWKSDRSASPSVFGFYGLDFNAPLLAVCPLHLPPRRDDADDVVLHPPVPELARFDPEVVSP